MVITQWLTSLMGEDRFVYMRSAFLMRIKCLWLSQNACTFKFHYTGEGTRWTGLRPNTNLYNRPVRHNSSSPMRTTMYVMVMSNTPTIVWLTSPHHFSKLNFISKIWNFTIQINAYKEETKINTEVNGRVLMNIGTHWNIRHSWIQRVPIFQPSEYFMY